MKKVEAIIRINRLEEVQHALEAIGIHGMSVESVRGYGRQQGRTDLYRGSTYALNLLPKLHVELIVEDEAVEPVLDAIAEACRTGEFGDGKLFVSDVLDAIRIRTG
ncbi:MAG: transcriptional regulator, partial [Armatimonadota bacterium]